MKPLPLWSLRKLPKTGVYALSSPCRTTSLFVSKESDGRIFHDPREKKDVLSLKMKKKAFCIPFLLSHVWSSPLSYPSFCFSFLYSHFSFSFLFHFLFIFSFLFSFLSSNLENTSHTVKGENCLPLSSNQRCGYAFSIFIPYFSKTLIMTSSPHGLI